MDPRKREEPLVEGFSKYLNPTYHINEFACGKSCSWTTMMKTSVSCLCCMALLVLVVKTGAL